MAVIVRTMVNNVDRDMHDRLEQAINANIERAGGPPLGLMAHVGHPDDDDLAIVEIFNTEQSFQAWWSDVIAPALDPLQLHTPRCPYRLVVARP